MKALVLVLTSVVSGCAAPAAVAPYRVDAEVETVSKADARPARSTSGSRTQTVGLPLSRAGKIGLWAGVAVFLAYLMDSDGEDEVAASNEP